MLDTFLTGFLLGLGLIAAIGAQNAFVLRQGLRNAHVFAVCLTCALSDAILIAAGAAGFGVLSTALPWLEPVLRHGGAGFLILYAGRSFLAAWRGQAALLPAHRGVDGLAATLVACLAFTWLNPHVYLDTVVLLGSVASQYPGREAGFALGAIIASFAFFFALGYGARLLRPVLARPGTWRLLDLGVGLVMLGIAARLLTGNG